ncbi:ATP-binding protein [Streptomyces laurentii]|uniref:ATP-binding protein n=1 Tax=Streptomyces laurentii TaxID=39478 RepID=UPI0033C3BFF7
MRNALLVAPAPHPDPPVTYWFTGPNRANSAALARHWVADLLRGNGHPLLQDRAELCTSELVTNVHRHTRSQVITVEVSFAAGHVLVRVHDDSPDREPQPQPQPQPQPADPYTLATSGRGLELVDALADCWSVVSDETSKSVWFLLHATEPEPDPDPDPDRARPEPSAEAAP